MKLGWDAAVMTRAEYEANLNGLNMFFGAMLGLVMAGTERLNGWVFAYVLAIIAGIVINILYISASRHRLAYAALAIVMSFVMPDLIGRLTDDPGALPAKVQPTLIVWAAMVTLIEFLPRKPAEERAP